MGRKVLMFCVQVIVTAIIYYVVLWLFHYISKDETVFDWADLVQALIFAIIFVPLSNWAQHRKK